MAEPNPTTFHNDMTCPSCGYVVNAATIVTDVEGRPSDGDVSVCISCTNFMAFVLPDDGPASLRTIGDDEFLDLPMNTKEVLNRMQRVIREHRAAHPDWKP